MNFKKIKKQVFEKFQFLQSWCFLKNGERIWKKILAILLFMVKGVLCQKIIKIDITVLEIKIKFPKKPGFPPSCILAYLTHPNVRLGWGGEVYSTIVRYFWQFQSIFAPFWVRDQHFTGRGLVVLCTALASVFWVLLNSSTSSASDGVCNSAERGRRPSLGPD